MNMQRFRICAETYGSQRHRWPTKDQPLFDALINTPEGAQVLAQAEQIDLFLDKWHEDEFESSFEMRQRILKLASPPAQKNPRSWGRLWMPLTSFSVAMGVAFAVGFHQAVEEATGLAIVGRMVIDPTGWQGGGAP